METKQAWKLMALSVTATVLATVVVTLALMTNGDGDAGGEGGEGV